MRDKIFYDVAMFRTRRPVQVGDRFQRRSHVRRVYAIERFIDFTNHPRHVCLVAVDQRESLTIALSALLDGSVFERIKDASGN